MSEVTWQWKQLSADDAEEVEEIIAKIEIADKSPIRTSREEIDSYFLDSHVWRAQGAYAADELLAFGLARTLAGNSGDHPITISGGVAPEWRAHGLGKELLERQLVTARGLADQLHIDNAMVHIYVDYAQDALMDLVTDQGFGFHSQFVQMRRKLDSLITGEETSHFIQIVTLNADWMKETRKAHNRVLGDSTSWSKMSAQDWRARIEQMEKDWCLVAVDLFGDRPRLAGYLLASGFSSNDGSSQNEPVYDEGYVEEIVVLPEWRGKHVATSLITAAMERFRDAGLAYIGLDVNVELQAEGPELITVFEHFGFERVAETCIVTTTV